MNTLKSTAKGLAIGLVCTVIFTAVVAGAVLIFQPDGIHAAGENVALIEGEWVNPALIEQVLKMHARVNHAIVTVVPDRQGSGRKLVAGVDANELNADELFQHCREVLPGPVPASVISISGLPFRSRRQLLAHISRMAG